MCFSEQYEPDNHIENQRLKPLRNRMNVKVAQSLMCEISGHALFFSSTLTSRRAPLSERLEQSFVDSDFPSMRSSWDYHDYPIKIYLLWILKPVCW